MESARCIQRVSIISVSSSGELERMISVWMSVRELVDSDGWTGIEKSPSLVMLDVIDQLLLDCLA